MKTGINKKENKQYQTGSQKENWTKGTELPIIIVLHNKV